MATTPIERADDVAALFSFGGVEARRVVAHEGHRSSLFDVERDATTEMAPRRLDEFASARAAAHDALAALGLSAAIERGPQRQPIWPDGITGSITHTRGHCIAAVARRAREDGDVVIGLDVEERSRVSTRVARRVLTESEHAELDELDPDAAQFRVAAIFGVKEAFYKAHHQLDPRYLGFDVIEVALQPDGHVGFTATGHQLTVDPATEAFGRVWESDGRIVAAAWIRRAVRSAADPRRIPSAP